MDGFKKSIAEETDQYLKQIMSLPSEFSHRAAGDIEIEHTRKHVNEAVSCSAGVEPIDLGEYLKGDTRRRQDAYDLLRT